jgi:uncharacterized small protein (DUF1192 family)
MKRARTPDDFVREKRARQQGADVFLFKPNTRDRAAFVTQWRDLDRNDVETVLKRGQLLIDAKDELKHGQFEDMVKTDFKISPQAGRMLMKVARHVILSNRNHGCDLPNSWRTLYDLTKLPDELLLECLKDGRVHARMERKDVTALRRTLPPSYPNGTKGRILEILKETPSTAEELRHVLPEVHPQTITARLNELAAIGWAIDTGERRKNGDNGGRASIVYAFNPEPKPIAPSSSKKTAKAERTVAKLRARLTAAEAEIERLKADRTHEATRPTATTTLKWHKVGKPQPDLDDNLHFELEAKTATGTYQLRPGWVLSDDRKFSSYSLYFHPNNGRRRMVAGTVLDEAIAKQLAELDHQKNSG